MVLFVSWLATYQWTKIIKNSNYLRAGAHKLGKVASFWPNFDLFLPIFGELKNGKLYILKKVGLSKFKEILWKYVYEALPCFFTYFYFAWKGTLRP